MDGRPVDVEHCNRYMSPIYLVSFPWAFMLVTPKFIRANHESHPHFTTNAFGKYGYEQRIGRNTVTIHSSNVPKHGKTRTMIFRQPSAIGVLRLQNGVHVAKRCSCYHHISSPSSLFHPYGAKWPQSEIQLDTRATASVSYALSERQKVLSALYMMKNSKLLKTRSATKLSCNLFLPVIRSVAAYSRIFEDAYWVLFHAAFVDNSKLVDIKRYLMSS